MGVERAVGEPGLLHDVGYTGAGVAAAADGPRRDRHDALVRSLLGRRSGAVSRCSHVITHTSAWHPEYLHFKATGTTKGATETVVR